MTEAMKNIFKEEVVKEVVARINQLTPSTQPLWGKMSVDQMLAHCNVMYEFIYDDIHSKPNPIKKFLLKTFVKKAVVNEKMYSQNTMTAPEFKMKASKNFEEEKIRLIGYITKTQLLGEDHFDGKDSHSFGVLTKTEWNNMFYKHLDHHLTQFGV